MRSLMRAFKNETEKSLDFISNGLWSLTYGTIPRTEDVITTLRSTRLIPSEEQTQIVSRLVSLPGMIAKGLF